MVKNVRTMSIIWIDFFSCLIVDLAAAGRTETAFYTAISRFLTCLHFERNKWAREILEEKVQQAVPESNVLKSWWDAKVEAILELVLVVDESDSCATFFNDIVSQVREILRSLLSRTRKVALVSAALVWARGGPRLGACTLDLMLICRLSVV
jgi:hypothetical protein